MRSTHAEPAISHPALLMAARVRRPPGFALLGALLERVDTRVRVRAPRRPRAAARVSPCWRHVAAWRQAHHGRATDAGSLERAGSLLSWISGATPPADSVADRPPLAGTFAPHVDKANRPLYDVSALLYLTSAGAGRRPPRAHG